MGRSVGGAVIIDVHAHCIPPTFLSWLRGRGGDGGVRLFDGDGDGAAHVEVAGITVGPLRSELSDLGRRLQAMDRMGIDVQILAGWIDLVAYELDGDAAALYVRAHNESLAEEAGRHPDRFGSLATVPLQTPVAAADELDHVMTTLGMQGVQIGTRIGGLRLDQVDLDPFWAAAERLGAFVLLHSGRPPDGNDPTGHFLDTMVGRPAETTTAIASLIFSGVLERFPGLTICAVQGGGFAPYHTGRLDRGYAARRETDVGSIGRPPSTYLRSLYTDTIVHDPAALALLVARVGAGHVLLGTDYPFEMGEDDPVALIRSVPGLDDSARTAMLGATAAGLLGR